MDRARISRAMIVSAIVLALPGTVSAATGGGTLDGGAVTIDRFLDQYGDPFADLAPLPAAVAALEERMRDHGDLASVIALAPELLEALPESPRLNGLHAAALAAAGDNREATRIVDEHPTARDTVWGQVAVALSARARGDMDAAATSAAQALSRAPDNAYALSLSGTLAAQRGDLAGAEAALSRAVAAAPEAASYHTNLGAVRLSAGDLDAAVSALTAAIDLAPQSCEALSMRGSALAATGRTDAAATDFEACLAVAPENRAVAAQLVSARLQGGDLDSAATAVHRHAAALDDVGAWQSEIALRGGDTRAVRAAPVAPATRAAPAHQERLAYADLIDGAAGAAADRLAPLLGEAATPGLRQVALAVDTAAGTTLNAEIRAQKPAEHFLRALVRSADGEMAGAAADMELAQDAIPGFTAEGLEKLPARGSAAPLAAGTALMLRGALIPAGPALSEAAGLGDPLAQYVAGVHARRTKAPESAAEHLSDAIAAAPEFRSAYLERAETHLALGDFAQAVADMRTALDLRAAPAVALRLGVIAEASGDDETARDAYETLLALEPDNFIANNQLAWFLLTRDGVSDRAFDLATRANALRPGNASILDTLGWLHYMSGDADTAHGYLAEAFEVSAGQMPVIRLHLAAATLELGDSAGAAALIAPLEGETLPEDLTSDLADLQARIASSVEAR